ncbi:MAG: hypothetical protein R3330_18545, partial [Saprospiraceae bacterium]|nr:hypothetical protein [Saprospiraceae bacterium]
GTTGDDGISISRYLPGCIVKPTISMRKGPSAYGPDVARFEFSLSQDDLELDLRTIQQSLFQAISLDFRNPLNPAGPAPSIRLAESPFTPGLGQAHVQPTKNREHLTISNIGSSGEDGISMQVGDATFASTAHPSIRMLHDDPPSTASGHIGLHPTVAREHLTISNIGSSGDDGVSLDLGDPTDPLFTGPSLQYRKPATGSSFLSFRPDVTAPILTMQTFTTAEIAIMLNDAFSPIPECTDCGPGLMLTAPATGLPETSGSAEIYAGVDDGVTLYRGGRLTVSNIGSSGEDGVSLDLSNAANPTPVSRIQHRVVPDHRLTFKTSVMELDPQLSGLLYTGSFDGVERTVVVTAKDGPDEIITE